MGNAQNCRSQRRFRHMLIIPMFLLFGSMLFLAQGRALSGDELQKQLGGGDGVERTAMRRWLIGSSPPKCERRCRSGSCRRCEAVQVPIVPQQQQQGLRVANSRGGDDISNYKPMAWKCKCGELLFNP